MMGYFVEFVIRTNMFFQNDPGDNYTDTQKALANMEVLAYMVRTESPYLVLRAALVNMDDYRINHPEEELEIIESL